MQSVAGAGPELLRAVFSLLPVAAGWFVGQRIVVAWELRKKRSELDMAAAERFQILYGDVKEVAGLWSHTKRVRDISLIPPAGLQWDLFCRAAAAESRYEALIIKLATERSLSKDQILTLALFRQGCQRVREAIHNDELVPASAFGPEYLLFNDLAAEVACLIGSNRSPGVVGAPVATCNLEQIARVHSADWQRKVEEYERIRMPKHTRAVPMV